MKYIFLFISALSGVLFSKAQVNVLDASTIPHGLDDKAHSIKREETIKFDVSDIDAARLTVHQVYTVFDQEGEDALLFIKYSSGFEKLEDAEIKVYDAKGKFINRYKKKEIRSEAIGEGLVEDGMAYFFRVTAPAFPITVQYDYEIKYRGTLNYPDYEIEMPEQSVESSAYTATVPANLDLRFKAKNINIVPVITTEGKYKTYRWQVKNLSAISEEVGSGHGGSAYPQVMIAPNKFSMDGNEGDLTSWKNFGMWYSNLAKGSINLTDETKAHLQQMVMGAANDKEKMKIIYKYLQNNFRYVSIQLGIGGFKPFEASFVNQKKYGDCKALSNYIQACFDAVGIVSYQTLINAAYNSESVDPSFPENGFNHVIICVPAKKDTTWLECTSNTTDFGVLGSFTENRNALLITPNGGVLVSTPKSKASENIFNMSTKITLNDDASGTSESVLKTAGEYKQEIVHKLASEKKDEQKNFLVNDLGFIQPDAFEISCSKDDSATVSFKFEIEKVPEFTAGSKMFISPRIYKIWKSKLPAEEKRTSDFYFECPFIKTDTPVYQLPADYTIENLPKAKDIKYEYGSLKVTYTYNDQANAITSVARLSLTQNIIPPDKFEATRIFFSSVIEEYTQKIVIKKK